MTVVPDVCELSPRIAKTSIAFESAKRNVDSVSYRTSFLPARSARSCLSATEKARAELEARFGVPAELSVLGVTYRLLFHGSIRTLQLFPHI